MSKGLPIPVKELKLLLRRSELVMKVWRRLPDGASLTAGDWVMNL